MNRNEEGEEFGHRLTRWLKSNGWARAFVGPHVRSGYPKETYLRRNVINPIRRSGRKEREKMNKRAVGCLVLVAVVLITLPLGVWFLCQSSVIENAGNVTAVIPTIFSTVNVYKPNVSRDFGCQEDHILP